MRLAKIYKCRNCEQKVRVIIAQTLTEAVAEAAMWDKQIVEYHQDCLDKNTLGIMDLVALEMTDANPDT